MKSEKRRYEMRDRAASAQATRERILEAAVSLAVNRWFDEVTLREIAAEAGVALQTVVNHFGTKEGVIAASIELEAGRRTFMAGRDASPVGNVDRAVECLVEDYERIGESVMRLLALEDRLPAVVPILERGRAAHREWVERTFPNALDGLRGTDRARRLDLLVCATDVYVWKLLRRDRKLSKASTAAAIAELVQELHPR